jgi:hypothetical protein
MLIDEKKSKPNKKTSIVSEDGANETAAENLMTGGNSDSRGNELDFLAREFAFKNDFQKYIKTSALFGTNVKNVFDEAIQHVYLARCQTLGMTDLKGGKEVKDGEKKAVPS